MNSCNSHWVARNGNDPSILKEVLGIAYIGREDGMGAASQDFIDTQTKHAGSAAIADLVIASGIHTAEHEEVSTALTNAHTLLKPGGALLIRAIRAHNMENEDNVAAETMTDIAYDAGFSRSKSRVVNTRTGSQIGPVVDSLSALLFK